MLYVLNEDKPTRGGRSSSPAILITDDSRSKLSCPPLLKPSEFFMDCELKVSKKATRPSSPAPKVPLLSPRQQRNARRRLPKERPASVSGGVKDLVFVEPEEAQTSQPLPQAKAKRKPRTKNVELELLRDKISKLERDNARKADQIFEESSSYQAVEPQKEEPDKQKGVAQFRTTEEAIEAFAFAFNFSQTFVREVFGACEFETEKARKMLLKKLLIGLADAK